MEVLLIDDVELSVIPLGAESERVSSLHPVQGCAVFPLVLDTCRHYRSLCQGRIACPLASVGSLC